jgi:hypothetical protein
VLEPAASFADVDLPDLVDEDPEDEEPPLLEPLELLDPLLLFALPDEELFEESLPEDELEKLLSASSYAS